MFRSRCSRPTLSTLEPRTLLTSAPAALGVMGDSFSNAARYGGVNPSWIEQLVNLRGLDFGAPTGDGGNAYAYAYDVPAHDTNNFVAYDAATVQTPALVQDIQSGAPIQAAVLEAGSHDLGPINPGPAYNDDGGNPITNTYLSIYNGQLTGTNLQDYIDRTLGYLMQAAQTLQQAGANMVVADIPDFGDVPALSGFDPSKRALVTAAVDTANAQLQTLTQAAGMPLVDFKALVDLTTASQVIGGVSVSPGVGSATGNPPAMYLDVEHPGGIPSGLFANMVIEALDGSYGYNIDPLTDQEILAACGVTPSTPGPTYFDVQSLVHQVDHVAPSTTLAGLAGPQGNNGWYTGGVTVTLSASDNRFGSGVASVQYSTDGGATWQNAVATGALANPNAPYGADGGPEYTLTLSADGVYHVLVRATDEAGNQEAPVAVPVIKIDQTPPASTPVADPSVLWPPNGRTVLVTVSGVISDKLSGVDLSGATYTVADSEGLLHLQGTVIVNADGSYRFQVALPAQRDGADKAGRIYTITIADDDQAGNLGHWSVTVRVPHDRGERHQRAVGAT